MIDVFYSVSAFKVFASVNIFKNISLLSMMYLLTHREWMRHLMHCIDSIYLITMSLTSWPKIRWIHLEFTKERG